MLKFAPLVLAVFLPLAAAPVAQGSVIDVKEILGKDSLAGLEIVPGESCPDGAGQAGLGDQVDGLGLSLDDVRPCPEGDAGPKALVANAAERVAQARERVAKAGERNAAAAASVPDSSSPQGAVDDGRASDAAVTGLAAQADPGSEETTEDDDPEITVDEDNDLTVQDDDALDDEDVTVDEDNDITVEDDDDESLPRTGLTLGVPALLGSLLLAGGVSLRRRIRRNDS